MVAPCDLCESILPDACAAVARSLDLKAITRLLCKLVLKQEAGVGCPKKHEPDIP